MCISLPVQVPLGLMLHNENKLDEMRKILEDLHKFVPTLPKEGEFTLPNGSTVPFDNTAFSEVLCGGDQLTVARMRSVKQLRLGHETVTDRFDAITPVIEDWHARVTLLVVSASL